ncbi:hypothetical protein J422_06698 [Methanocaldococcus villosus KIN24-T80]|uniref:Uncharacterized protein n=1 Tax=Methanocaldococcus villosus KIN24-T80 TaxID=1069083 RepID=N6VR84_9EURY|nr:UPF0058 family protein [Methanocaldococcus villosus]ENN95656.1 hypothetical protein J422_06698 [Methanocaldococcus villosus KIN24-T80]
MHKEDLMKLHQFFVYVTKELTLNSHLDEKCKELLSIYESLDIKPHHIHRLKDEQKIAILLLASCIAYHLSKNLEGVHKNLAKKLEENAFKHLKELKKVK